MPMRMTVFHGSPRKGNTYTATKIFMDALTDCGNVQFTEFFLPESMPDFCIGCQQCLGNPHEKCPHARYVTPVLDAILASDALLFTSPHYGACSMSGCMKNLLDHLDFLTLGIAPRTEIFSKKAFILTTGAGSTTAAKPIKQFLINWGINRVHTRGLAMFTNQWDKMPLKKQSKFENTLRRSARKFYNAPKGHPYLSTVFMYHLFKFTIRNYVGKGNYPYEYWKEKGYFDKRPF